MKKRFRPHRCLEQEAVEYVVQVKAYFQQDGRSFQGFTDIIQDIKTRKVNPVNLTEKLYELFKERKDLVLGFKSFVPDDLQLGVEDHDGSEHVSYSVGQEDSLREIRKDKESNLGEGFADNMEKVYRQVFQLFEKVRSSLGHPDECLKFLKHVHYYNSKQIGLSDVLLSLKKLCPNLGDEFEELLGNMEKLNKVENKKRKIVMDKSIHELDFSDCERWNPSYWHQPKEFVASKLYSQRSDLGSEVLNDEWVCRAPASRNFKLRRLDKYEKILNECEDERYESDVMVDSVEYVTKRIEDLLYGEDRIDFKTPFNIKDHLSILNLKVIERIRGECGLEVIDELSEKPDVWLPIVLSNLKKKLEMLKQDRADRQPLWGSVYTKWHTKLQRKEC